MLMAAVAGGTEAVDCSCSGMECGTAAQDTAVVGAFAEELGCTASEYFVSAVAAELAALAVVVEAPRSVAE
jgi:hypothetical protein